MRPSGRFSPAAFYHPGQEPLGGLGVRVLDDVHSFDLWAQLGWSKIVEKEKASRLSKWRCALRSGFIQPSYLSATVAHRPDELRRYGFSESGRLADAEQLLPILGARQRAAMLQLLPPGRCSFSQRPWQGGVRPAAAIAASSFLARGAALSLCLGWRARGWGTRRALRSPQNRSLLLLIQGAAAPTAHGSYLASALRGCRLCTAPARCDLCGYSARTRAGTSDRSANTAAERRHSRPSRASHLLNSRPLPPGALRRRPRD